MRFHLPTGQLIWIAPFVFLGLISLTLLRPLPVFPKPAQERFIIDGQGNKVSIPLPVHVIASNGSVDFLELTHAPEALSKAGNARARVKFAQGMWAKFYPQVAKNDSLWDNPGDVESRLALDDGAIYFERDSTASRRLGLAAVTFFPKAGSDYMGTLLRVENAALGNEERGKEILADFQQAYADLKQELQPDTLTNLPRVLPMGSSTKDWSNVWVYDTFDMFTDGAGLGVRVAWDGFEDVGRYQEAERVLAMNPDIVFVPDIEDFLHDSRWQGLKAVRNKSVYSGIGMNSGAPSHRIDSKPLLARWVAEVVHPERLQPKLRELARDHFMKAYGYRLSDAEIDAFLGVEQQKDAPGYWRFMKSAQIDTGFNTH